MTGRFLAGLHLLLPLLLGVTSLQGQVREHQLAAMQARSIGPAGMSGRIAAIDALATDPDIVYVGAATGGVWKSTNGGQTWKAVFDDQRVLGIGAVVVDQSNPDVVWVGTGEGNPRNSAGVGGGVYKSIDGGDTWTLLGLERSERIHRILLHPTDADIAYVGAMGPAWSDGKERGVFRTLDGGRSWERILYVDERTGVSDMVMDPTNPDKLIVGMWSFRRSPWFFESGGPGSGLYVTVDGGASWRRADEADGLPGGDLGRIGLAMYPTDPRIVYALVEARESALLRSSDGGRSWRTVRSGTGVSPRPFYYSDIFVDPENELRLYQLHSRLERSDDGGRTFENMGQGVHPDFHALWIDPRDPQHLYAGTDGGVYVSRDRGASWRMIDNLPVGQLYTRLGGHGCAVQRVRRHAGQRVLGGAFGRVGERRDPELPLEGSGVWQRLRHPGRYPGSELWLCHVPGRRPDTLRRPHRRAQAHPSLGARLHPAALQLERSHRGRSVHPRGHLLREPIRPQERGPGVAPGRSSAPT